MIKKMKKILFNQQSFTLVELIVAMSVFVVFVSIASGIFVSSLKTQRKVNNLVEIADNSGLLIEQLIREIRTGYNFYNFLNNSSTVDIENTTTLEFYNHQRYLVKYFFQDNNGKGRILKEVVEVDRNGNSSTKLYNLTPKEIDINYLYFTVKQFNHYCQPWRVTINLNIGSSRNEIKQNIDLQATVSSRILPAESPGFILNCK